MPSNHKLNFLLSFVFLTIINAPLFSAEIITSSNLLLDQPHPIAQEIVSYLSDRDMSNVALVCKLLRDEVQNYRDTKFSELMLERAILLRINQWTSTISTLRTDDYLKERTHKHLNAIFENPKSVLPDRVSFLALYTACCFGDTEIVKLCAEKRPTLFKENIQNHIEQWFATHIDQLPLTPGKKIPSIDAIYKDYNSPFVNLYNNAALQIYNIKRWTKIGKNNPPIMQNGTTINNSRKQVTENKKTLLHNYLPSLTSKFFIQSHTYSDGLLWAAIFHRNASLEIINILHEQNPELFNLKAKGSKLGYAPLHWACGANKLDITKFLIENGADVNERSPINNITPLHLIAIRSNDLTYCNNTINLLLKNHPSSHTITSALAFASNTTMRPSINRNQLASDIPLKQADFLVFDNGEGKPYKKEPLQLIEDGVAREKNKGFINCFNKNHAAIKNKLEWLNIKKLDSFSIGFTASVSALLFCVIYNRQNRSLFDYLAVAIPPSFTAYLIYTPAKTSSLILLDRSMLAAGALFTTLLAIIENRWL